MALMKYAVNHPYNFDNWAIACVTGMCQMGTVLLVESANFVVIQSSSSVLDVVMNFLALGVIAEFDDIFFKISMKGMVKQLIVEEARIFKIERTSSKPCLDFSRKTTSFWKERSFCN